ncbi:hypothetical protein [Reyranella sp.]|uniref:hypothetical protein n=1 Tax=Reyranella sp. TaxID=1929291 RepID=UPI00378472B2
MLPVLTLAAVVLGLPACVTSKGTLEGSRVETVRVDGRLYEVRIAPAESAGDYQLLLVRGTVVVDPDPKRESERNWNVVQPFLERTCKGPFVVLDHQLADKVNLFVRFRCGT